MKRIVIFTLIILGFTFCKKTQSVQEIEANMSNNMSSSENPISKKIKAGATILDVRTAGEFSSGHYKNAINIPVQVLETRLKELGKKSKAIVVYCASGFRSGNAKVILDNNGFTDVTNAGGLRDMP